MFGCLKSILGYTGCFWYFFFAENIEGDRRPNNVSYLDGGIDAVNEVPGLTALFTNRLVFGGARLDS